MEQAIGVNIDKTEAADNLRVAVKATLLVVSQLEYRLWAQKWLGKYGTEKWNVLTLDELRDRTADSIAELAGWQPWTTLGRARDSWFIVRKVCLAFERYAAEDWENATSYALDAANQSLELGRRGQENVLKFVRQLEQSLYGEVVS